MSRRVDQELDGQAEAILALDRRERGLDNRVGAIEGKVRADQVETIREHGLPADLVEVETSVWRRLSPARNRWPEIAAYDERVAELEQRQAEVSAELRELHERERAAPEADHAALAEWELSDRNGPRPEPTLSAIEERIQELQAEWEALSVAVSRVLVDKTAFVDKHRGRLVKEADSQADDAHRRYLAEVDQLAQTRQELRELRSAAVWARLYPAEQATHVPPDTFAGGRKRPLQAMGLAAPVAPGWVFDALRADADWLREAATPEQRAAVAGIDPRKPPNTVWDETDEGREWKRDQRQRTLERLRNQ